jgi:hypothetical protein
VGARHGAPQKVKGGRHQADAPLRTCQVQKTGYFFFAAFFFVAFFFAAFFLAAIRGSPPPDLLLGSCSPNYREGDAVSHSATRLAGYRTCTRHANNLIFCAGTSVYV